MRLFSFDSSPGSMGHSGRPMDLILNRHRGPASPPAIAILMAATAFLSSGNILEDFENLLSKNSAKPTSVYPLYESTFDHPTEIASNFHNTDYTATTTTKHPLQSNAGESGEPVTKGSDRTSRDVRSLGSKPVERKKEAVIQFPITFKTSDAFLTTKWKIYATFSIHFWIKTTQPDAILLYSGHGLGRDFMAVELVGGHIRYVFDVGSGPRSVEDKVPYQIHDNRWHEVSIIRPDINHHIVRVDDSTTVDTLPDSRSVHYDLKVDEVYVGGVPKTLIGGGSQLPKQLKSREGFQGCLASISLNDEFWKLADHYADIPTDFRGSMKIKDGCDGPAAECDSNSCHNGGSCIQQWDSFVCNCDQTTFTGPTCSDDSIAYRFGQLGGLITLSFEANERPDTKSDQLTFGFSTTQQDALLVRVASATSNDFIEVELVDGAIYVVYNLGLASHLIGDRNLKVDDGKYHILRFIRQEQNSSIQIDHLPVHSMRPQGRQLNTFNHQGYVFVGGKKDASNKITRFFQGTIAGLVLNGLWILELAADRDGRVSIEGDVELEIAPLKTYYISLASSFSTTVVQPSFLSPSSQLVPVTQSDFTKHSHKGSEGDGSIICRPESGCTAASNSTTTPTKLHSNARITLPVPGKIVSSTIPRDDPFPGNPYGNEKKPERDTSCLGNDDEDCDPQTSGDESSPSRKFVMSTREPVKYQDQRHFTYHQLLTLLTTISVNSISGIAHYRDTTSTDSTLFNRNQSPPKTLPVTPPTSGDKFPATEIPAGSAHKESTPSKSSPVAMSIGWIVGIVAGVAVFLFLLACAVYKYRNREEGTYSLDVANDYGYEVCLSDGPSTSLKSGASKSTSTSKSNSTSSSLKSKKKQSKEWYV